MIRDIEKKLIVWKNNPLRKPLIIRGARQVGKTYTIKNFGDENYETVHFVDFKEIRKLRVFLKKIKIQKELLKN